MSAAPAAAAPAASAPKGEAPLAIRVEGLSKRYHIFEKPQHRLLQTLFRARYSREFAALDGVSFEVARGETVGIIGRNGSGKSTLLQLISGTLTPTAGHVEVVGRIAALLELGAGFNPEFTGLENVYVNAALMGLTRAQVDERLDRILAFADIGDFVNQPVKTYSSGMFVRLAFAVIAHVDADVLVIDEALAVGDAFFTQKCMRFLRTFRERGTILFVSHDSTAVVNLCERAIWIDHGKIRALGDAKTVSELYLKGSYESEQGASAPGAQAEAIAAASVSAAPVGEAEAKAHGAEIAEGDGEVEGALAGITALERDDLGTSFGKLGAVVRRVRLLDPAGEVIVAIEGGEHVRLVVEADARVDIDRPLVGFHVKDRLGQILFGDNTFVRHRLEPARIDAGRPFQAEFSFTMPYLRAGDYTVTAAVGEGTQDEHVIHHWIHDALAFRSQSAVIHGLFGVPTKKVIL